jgi:glutaredoxin 3
MAEVKIYTTRLCGYCIRAKALLNSKRIKFEEIDVSGDLEMRRWLQERTGRSTVPQIFINGKSLGGYDELAALNRQGQLDRLLAVPVASA